MVIRHFVLAGLVATASLAQAGVVEPGAAQGPQAAWSSAPGAGSQAAPANPLQVMMAGPGKWTGHTRLGDRSATSTMLFTQKTYGTVAPAAAASAPVAAELSPVQSVPMPAAMAPVTIDPPQADASAGAGASAGGDTSTGSGAAADTSGLINAGGGLVSVGGGANAAIDVVAPAAVPEPATGMLMLAGLLGAGALVRRRK